jgi:translation elongation factor EF-Ts
MTESAGDKSVLDHIHDLVAEEKALRSAHAGVGMTDDDRARLKELQGQLDQAWDLLRQRRAREEYDEDPDESAERPVENVTKYLQ